MEAASKNGGKWEPLATWDAKGSKMATQILTKYKINTKKILKNYSQKSRFFAFSENFILNENMNVGVKNFGLFMAIDQ